MEYLFLPKEIENNRNEEVRVVDGWEVEVGDDKHKFVVQTRIVVGGMATVKPDWVTISITAQTLHEDSPHTTPMKEFQGQQIWLPNNEQYNPRPDALSWHRQTFWERAC